MKFVVPARFILAILGFWATLNLYVHRVNLNIALVDMVTNPVEKDRQNHTAPKEGTVCTELMSQKRNISSKRQAGEFDWSGPLQGQILGSLFYGIVITPIPLGILSAKFHAAKWMLGGANFIIGAIALVIPVAARWHYGALIACRVVQGMATGVILPSVHTLIGNWIPVAERSRVNTIIFNGIAAGTVSAYSISGPLIYTGFLGGWPSVFYVSGFVMCIWFLLWIFLVYESPKEHPRITKEEVQYISDGQFSTVKIKTDEIPWKSILTSVPVWALVFTHFCNNWGFYTLMMQLPTYLANVLFFNIIENGLLSALPYVIGVTFACVASLVADFLLKRETFNTTLVRKIMTSVAFFLPALCLILVPLMGCRPAAIVTLLTLSNGFNSFKYSGFLITHVDMTPHFAGMLMAITSSIANTAGFLAPIFVGWCIKTGHNLENWRTVFLTSAAIFAIGGLCFAIFCTADEQTWGEMDDKDEPASQNQIETKATDSVHSVPSSGV